LKPLEIVPITIKGANALVASFHRHHKPVVGALFAIGIQDTATGEPIGAAIVGRPVARMLQDGFTAEVTRLVVKEGFPNACSMLYSSSWRAARALGYRRLITYILESEDGTSLKASNWRCLGVCGGGSWDRENRPRTDKHPIDKKVRWEATTISEIGEVLI
jgi:tRNA A37 N6-isopentenylltransferase MiaA